ncbi:MAG: carboxypeptidase regulatory-like domain-containing protein, partial [Flavobacteriales bacterium]|nr:carboxypeptidase regulatory-like domain-containing protein [Flavobacteriales bacterium]
MSAKRMRLSLSAALLLTACAAWAQGTATLTGVVRDEQGGTLPQANVQVVGTTVGAVSDATGSYRLELPAGRELHLRWTYTGHVAYDEDLLLNEGEERGLDVRLRLATLPIFEVRDRRAEREQGIERIDPRLARFNPSPLGGVEALLGGQIGVVMRNELSSGYSVRGGNFDENLVYVNDIEVYRPFLVRAGQQEGLSFPNPDMIERISFSAGGFEARYGDKMSSVLDIQYKKPRKFSGTAMASLLGG